MSEARKASVGRALFVVIAMFWFTQWSDTDLAGAFIRSLVDCDTPAPPCPRGSLEANGTCQAVPAGQDDWSGSARCLNADYTIEHSVQLAGRLAIPNLLGQVLASATFGMTLVDSWGRKPMLIMPMVGFLICNAIFFWLCWSEQELDSSNFPLYFAILISASMNTFDIATQAMSMDGTERNAEARGAILSQVMMAKEAGTLIGYSAGFFVLYSCLTDYTRVWEAFLFLLLILMVVTYSNVSETKPQADALLSLEAGGDPRSGGCLRELGDVTRLIHKDPVLRWAMWLSFLSVGFFFAAFALSGPWSLTILGYNQAVASLMGVLFPVMSFVGAAISPRVMNCFGVYGTVRLGSFMYTLGMTMTGLGGIFPEQARWLYWIGLGVVSGLAIGIVIPASSAIVSVRVEDKHQGKVFAAMSWPACLGQAVCTYVFTNVIINDSTKLVEQVTSCWFIAAFGEFLAMLGWNYVCWLDANHRVREEPGQASASAS